MLGMVEGNGHPYSWSAIVNGYDPEAMAACPYPAIPAYLNAEPKENFGIEGAKVTHIWCDRREDAEAVAKASFVPNILEQSEGAIGQVDAVIIPTDKGEEHLDRARPFIEAGLPVFIDKPLTIREDHLQQFAQWVEEGKPILSTSCMRYAREYRELREDLDSVGEVRLITMTTAKSWERYGIHALEGVYPFLDPGDWLDVTNTGTEEKNVVHLRHASGTDVVIAAIADLYGAFGYLNVYGTKGSRCAVFGDTFHAFKAQLVAFVNYLKTGERPFPFAETVELMKIVIAGIKSREEGGGRIALSEIAPRESQ
jgi:predicted dehydrogenase